MLRQGNMYTYQKAILRGFHWDKARRQGNTHLRLRNNQAK